MDNTEGNDGERQCELQTSCSWAPWPSAPASPELAMCPPWQPQPRTLIHNLQSDKQNKQTNPNFNHNLVTKKRISKLNKIPKQHARSASDPRNCDIP